MKWLVLACLTHVAVADDVKLKLDHEPVSRHLRMRPKKVGAVQKPAPPPVVPAPSPTTALADEPAQIRDLQQRVSAQIDLGYVVDGTQLVTNPGASPINDQFAKIRAYGFGEGYLSTHGVAFDSLSTYFAGRFLLVNRNLSYQPGNVGADKDGDIKVAPPIATWFERSNFEPRSAWAEVKDFLGDPAYAPLRLRGGEQYIYGPWVLHFYGATAAWEGKLVKASIYGGSQVPDYTVDPNLPEAREAIVGGSIRFDLRDLQQKIPITVGIETLKLSSGNNTEDSNHSQVEIDWRPRKDFALIGQARSLGGKFVNEHAQLRVRWHEVSNLTLDVTHQASTDWLWDPTVLEPDPIAARRYLDLGPMLPRVLASVRAGTLIAENIDFYARGAAAADLSADKTRDTYSPTYYEGGGAIEVRVRRTVALGVSGMGRWYQTNDSVDAEIMDTPGVPDLIPVNGSSQMGEHNFGEFGATARMTLGARKFSLLVEAYGRRTRYAFTYCALTADATDCQSATDTGIPTLQYRGGGRAQIDAWIGSRLRLFASYDLSTSLDFTHNITGYKSLRLMMEGVY
ncbi:MAG TPA: hypothetical protein VGC41_18310 [Kofleriaceae bacterium]